MEGELRKQVKRIIKDKESAEMLEKLIVTAGQEFPCLTCPSRDECKTFNWFTQWFGDGFKG